MNVNLFVNLIYLISILVREGQSLQCWTCSSIYEPGCDDPFKPNDLTSGIEYFLYDCNLDSITNGSLEEQHLMEHVFGHEAKTYCRKTVRKAIGMTIIYRGCSFGNVPKKDCSDGPDDAVCETSACFEDGCNKALVLVSSIYIPVITCLLLFPY